jgi:hypothetical protein
MWQRLPEQQQRGAQLANRRREGEAPAVASAGREAQDHEQADVLTSPDGEPARGIDYPADPIERRRQDITPDAPDPQVDWDTRVEPERVDPAEEEGEG